MTASYIWYVDIAPKRYYSYKTLELRVALPWYSGIIFGVLGRIELMDWEGMSCGCVVGSSVTEGRLRVIS